MEADFELFQNLDLPGVINPKPKHFLNNIVAFDLQALKDLLWMATLKIETIE